MTAPTRKVSPPTNIEEFLPYFLVTVAAMKEATNADRYRDDVNSVRSWLSNLQYWLVDALFASK